jgi:DNA-directed RNA polymerase specialized sigma24 family protein
MCARPDVRHQPLPDDEAGAARLGHVNPEEGEGGLGLSPELEGRSGRLTQRKRELVALRFGGDLTGPEIANLTGLSLTNVQQILRARCES